MYSYIFIILGLFCYGSAFCQVDYSLYLKKTNQAPIQNNYQYDSLILKNDFQIRFSKNDTSMFVNLITKDTVFSILESDISSGLKKLGGLCADFDNAFFWGISMGNDIYGRVYKKTNKSSYSKEYIFISKYNLKNRSVILLADPNYISNVNTLYVYGNYNFLEYYLSKPILPLNLKYLRIIQFKGNKIQLRDIKNNKFYTLTLKEKK